MIAHGHSDVKFAHHALHWYPMDSNHIIYKAFMWYGETMCVLSKLSFENAKSIHLYEEVLDKKKMYANEHVIAKKIPLIMQVQLDYCVKDNQI